METKTEIKASEKQVKAIFALRTNMGAKPTWNEYKALKEMSVTQASFVIKDLVAKQSQLVQQAEAFVKDVVSA